MRWDISEVGLTVVEHVFNEMKVDSEWSTVQEDGFTWWGKDFAQKVWAEPAIKDDGFWISRLHARTDIAAGFKATPENMARLSALNRFASLSALIPDGSDASEIRLAASMYVHRQTLPMVKRLFSIAVAMQAADAQIKGEVLAKALGARPAISGHPKSGRRPDPDDMLNVIAGMVAPLGERPSAWAGNEMREAVDQLQRFPCVLATGDHSGLSAEFPFFEMTSLLTIRTNERHPQLGNGMLVRLSLPVGCPKEDWARVAIDLNARELRSLTRSPFLGSWCAGDDAITFVSFYPNVAHQPGLLQNLVNYSMGRARWVAEEVYGDDWKQSFRKAFSAKMRMFEMFREAFEHPKNSKLRSGRRRERC